MSSISKVLPYISKIDHSGCLMRTPSMNVLGKGFPLRYRHTSPLLFTQNAISLTSSVSIRSGTVRAQSPKRMTRPNRITKIDKDAKVIHCMTSVNR